MARRRRTRNPLRVEPLEDRSLPAGVNTFAQFAGVIASPTDRPQVPITLLPADFTLTGSTIVGLHLQRGGASGLDPAVVQVRTAAGAAVAPRLVTPDLPNNQGSLVLVDLSLGGYVLTVGSERNTAGAYTLDVFLAGDANGDRGVTNADVQAVLASYGAPAGGRPYVLAADANLNGTIDNYDHTQARTNLNDRTAVHPLALTAGLTPAPTAQPDGTLLVTTADVQVTGATRPGGQVVLNSDADGQFDDGSATADGTGGYAIPVRLASGPNALRVRTADGFGQWREAELWVTFQGDATPPVVTLTAPAEGVLTNANLTVTGTATDAGSGVTGLTASVDGGAAVNVPLSPTSGTFSFTTALPLNGTAEGAHAVRFEATDAAGNRTAVTRTFSLDTRPPAAAALALAVGSRAGGPFTASAGRVALSGTAEPGSRVTLSAAGLVRTALASNTGAVEFPDVPLDVGPNEFAVSAADAAGNVASATLTVYRGAAPAQQDAVLRWTQVTLDAVRADASAPTVATRAMAMVFGAVYDAVAAVEGKAGYFVTRPAGAGRSADAAVTAAAHQVLSYLYPVQKAAFDAARAAALAGVPDGSEKDAGVALGELVAEAVIDQRRSDGFDTFAPYATAGQPGQWVPTVPMYVDPLDPHWADLRPFALARPDQFRPVAPPALTGATYAADLNEVQSLGRRDSAARTADQTQIARFWADGAGTETPPGHWLRIAMQVAEQQGNSLGANARLMALLGIALADAAIACWDAKYEYGFWRPVTAVRQADADGNPDTTVDREWVPLITTPNFPEYASGHSTFSTAAAEILASVFGDDVGFAIDSNSLPGVTRTFAGFRAAAAEAGRSRIYGGIHFENSNQVSQQLGRDVAERVLAVFDPATDTVAPAVTVLTAADMAVRANPTVVGRVRDNLSGVAQLEARTDGGAWATLAADANGNFSLTPAFATDGTADGRHVLAFRATDAAGNVSDPVEFAFTLATRGPAITLAGPAAGATVAAGSLLAGTAGGGAAAVVSLTYAFGTGQPIPVSFDTAGNFRQPLDVSRLTAGTHSLTLTATDAAGNVATASRPVVVAELVPFTISGLTPADGTGDVGVTFRPQVFFSRQADPATLTAETIYATDAAGTRMAATVVPADDGSFAWLFFAAPLTGASLITVHVNGAGIRAAAGGTLLDADGDGTPGGMLEYSFTTVGLASIPGTTLSGVLNDPGADLKSGTTDDLRAGPDGSLMTADDVYLNPIAGAKVYVLGREDTVAYTDAQGRFALTDLPAGTVKLVIDGRTATNAPAGFYFPEMVMDLSLEAGRSNTVMGSMGTGDQQRANENLPGVYLPRIRQAALQTVSAASAAPVEIRVGAESAQGLTPEQRDALTIQVSPASLIGENGQPLASARIGISTVPPDLVREMLPAGVLQHTFDITVQAPGVAAFATPAPMTFPNVFGAAPGTKLNFLSFDHTTGRLVIEGTATVSADGKTVTTDPGTGITKPGWHGLTPPGNRPKKPFDINAYKKKHQENQPKKTWLDKKIDSIVRPDPNLPQREQRTLAIGVRGSSLADPDYLFGFGTATSAVPAGYTRVTPDTRFAPAAGFGWQLEDDESVRGFDGGNATASGVFSVAVPDGLYGVSVTLGEPGVGHQSMGVFPQTVLTNTVSTRPGQLVQNLYVFPSIDGRLELAFAGLEAIGEVAVKTIEVQRLGDIPASPPAPAELAVGQQFHYAFQNLDTKFVVRGSATSVAEMTAEVFFAAETRYLGLILDPLSFTVSSSVFTTPVSGIDIQLPEVVLSHPLTLDINSAVVLEPGEPVYFGTAPSGLTYEMAFILGTSTTRASTAGDGISDLAKVRQGLDPLAGRGLPTGVVGGLALVGQPQAVALAGSALDAGGQTAFVAAGSGGLAVVNATQFTQPRVLAQLALPGTAADVAVDAGRGLAAVAAGFSGVHVVNVADPTAPTLVRTVALPYQATAVQVYDGLAYVANGRAVTSIDLQTGEIVQALTVTGGAVTDIAREGNFLYALDSSDTLRVIDLSDFAMTVRGSVGVPGSGNKLSAGNGLVYVAAGSGGFTSGGFSVVDVADPADPVLVSGPDVPAGTGYAGQAVVANGSGLGIAVGAVQGSGNVLDLFDTADPAETGRFVTRIDLDGTPTDVALGAGIAFVATSTGLQVVNYRSFDANGQAPTVSMTLGVPGTSVPAGSSIPVRLAVADDVQVRNVELLVNGRVVANNVALPYDFVAVAPAFVAGATNTVTIQVRATDTGGNVAESAPVTLSVVADTAPPAFVGSAPAAGQQVYFTPSVDLRFSKPLDPAAVTTAGFTLQLLAADGTPTEVVPLARAELLSLGRRVALYPSSPLGTGRYRLTAAVSAVVSRGGVPLAAPAVVEFEVRTASDIRPASGTPAVPRAPAANPNQEVALVVPWSPDHTLARFPTVSFNTAGTAQAYPLRVDAAARAAVVRVPTAAATGDVLVYGQSAYDYTRLARWTATRGTVDVFGTDAAGYTWYDPATGATQYVHLDGGSGTPTTLESAAYQLAPGTYELRFRLRGGQFDTNAVTVRVGTLFNETFTRPAGSAWETITRTITVPAATAAAVSFEHAGSDGSGLFLDDVRLAEAGAGGRVLLADDFLQTLPDGPLPLLIVPTLAAGQLQVYGSGYRGGTMYLYGTGFVADQVSVTIGGQTIAATAGAYDNTYLYVEVPADAVPGPITVTTAGGTTTAYPLALSGVAGVAASGTPADAAVPSANPGQAITLSGTGLSATSQVVVQVQDYNGAIREQVVSPIAAAADGTRAMLVLPTNAVTGDVEVVGDQTASRFRVQVVPVVTTADLYSVSGGNGAVYLTGSGFVNDGTTYTFGTEAVADDDAQTYTINSGEAAYLGGTLPLGGGWRGAVRVTTAGGTSAPYVVGATAVVGVAAAGTPADPAKPSANPGQAFALTGVGLTDQSRALVEDGAGYVRLVAPAWVSGDGTQAGYDLPTDAAGVVRVSLLGAAVGADLQVVPVVTSASVSGTSVFLGGRGFVTGQAYRVGGVARTPSSSSESYGNAYLYGLPAGLTGAVEVTTAGGTSAPVPVTGVPTPGAPVLTGLEGAAQAGTPADPAAAAANVGQTITVVGSNLSLDTRVVFPVRFNNGPAGTTEVQVLAVSADGTRAQVRVPGYAVSGGVRVAGGAGAADLQVVPTLDRVVRRADGRYELYGSGFAADEIEVTIGGVVVATPLRDDAGGDVYGQNDFYAWLTVPFGLDGPVTVRTAGGSAVASPVAPRPVYVAFTGVRAAARLGVPADPAAPSANTGQEIVLVGEAFTTDTRVTFDAVDASGAVGTVTRTGYPSTDRTELRVVVPGGARTGTVRVAGAAGTGVRLQVVPAVRAVGGAATPGGQILLDGVGLLTGDLEVTVGGRPATVLPTGRVVSDAGVGQQLVDVRVAADAVGGAVEVRTAGGSARFAAAVSPVTLPDRAIAIDPADTLAAARVIDLPADARLALTGNRVGTANDVDLFRVRLDAGDRLGMAVAGDANLWGVFVRVFDAAGTQLAAGYLFFGSPYGIGDFAAAAGGEYYVGVSGVYNSAYDPRVPGSGGGSSPTGGYALTLARTAAGSTSVAGLTATLGSGTAARAGVAAANAGQTVTLTGVGFRPDDRVAFLAEYYGGSTPYLTTVAATPTAVAADGTSLTVVVPPQAATGVVRLERQTAGVLLQVVPTLTDVDAGSAYRGGTTYVYGTGFAAGNTRANFGPASRSGGLYAYTYDAGDYASVTTPAAAGSGPITVTTPGGTSAAFALTVTGLAGAAGSGTPADPARPSANPGQAVTLTGVGLDLTTDVVFRVMDYAGNGPLERVVTPVAVAPDGTSMVVVVPDDAVTGDVEVVGDRGNGRFRLQVVPVVTDAYLYAVSGATGAVYLTGTGFVNDGATYAFGTEAVVDDDAQTYSINSGRNAYLSFTLPLGGGWRGAVTVTTAGGTSAPFVRTAAVASVAASGTPADAGRPSANPGQAVVVSGTGLTWENYVLVAGRSGAAAFQRVVPPAWVSGDGTRAGYDLPTDVAGVAELSMVGAAAAMTVQVVPVVTAASVSGTSVYLGGRGFVDGQAYRVGGVSQTPTSASVSYSDAYLYGLPAGLTGAVEVATAGGTSAPVPVAGVPAPGAAALTGAIGAAHAGTPADPAAAAANVGQTVTLVGTNFTLTTRITFPTQTGAAASATEVTVLAVSADGTRAQVRVPGHARTGSLAVVGGTGAAALQVVPTLDRVVRRPDGSFDLYGSGFMGGGTRVTVGGTAIVGPAADDAGGGVSGPRNDYYGPLFAPLRLDGPVEVQTDGGTAAVAAPGFAPPAFVEYAGVTAAAALGDAADPAGVSANPGQAITLVGRAFTSQTVVGFPSRDPSGTAGTVSATGTPSFDGTRLSVVVPTLAVTGRVRVVGAAGDGVLVQVVPAMRAVGGTVAGGTLTVDGVGLLTGDLAVTVDGIPAAVAGGRLTGAVGQQLLDVTVPAGASAGVVRVATAGGSHAARTAATVAALPDVPAAADPGDTLGTAAAVGLAAGFAVRLTGESLAAAGDVDLFRVRLDAGDRLTAAAALGTGLWGAYLRLFDAAGTPVGFGSQSDQPAIDGFVAPAAGDYFVGVSGYYNSAYDPRAAGSGNGASSPTGGYALSLTRVASGSTSLSGVTTTAASGTPARAGVGSANPGQTVTLTGVGLRPADRVVFTVTNYYGSDGQLYSRTVTPANVAADGTSLTVVVPDDAVTGAVRLERETAGVLLQVVPVVTDVAADSAYRGGGVYAYGTGFAGRGGMSNILLDGASVGYTYGASAYYLYGRAPADAPTGPIQIATAGGVSAAFDLAFTGLSATAATGSPADPGRPSANRGQTVTLTGTGLNAGTQADTLVVFRVDDGTQTVERTVQAQTVAADGTSLTVVVPSNAVTGFVEVIGDRTGSRRLLQIV